MRKSSCVGEFGCARSDAESALEESSFPRVELWFPLRVDSPFGVARVGRCVAFLKPDDGRIMMASVFRRDRFPPMDRAWTTEEKAQLFDDMLAYVATYHLEEGRVIHEVDGSWNPNWQGALDRPFTLEENRLFISGAPGIDPATGEEVIYRMEFTKD